MINGFSAPSMFLQKQSPPRSVRFSKIWSLLFLSLPAMLLKFAYDNHQLSKHAFIPSLYTGVTLELLFLALIGFVVYFLLYFGNYIEYDGQSITIKRGYYPFLSSLVIRVNDIQKIDIVTITPLIQMRNDLCQINWRERIIIAHETYMQPTPIMIQLCFFPHFKHVLLDVVKKRPDIPISFAKKTITQNIRETLRDNL